MSVFRPSVVSSEEQAVQDLRDCVYHGRRWRGTYQALLNTTTTIPAKRIRTIGKLICLCKTAGDYLGKTSTLLLFAAVPIEFIYYMLQSYIITLIVNVTMDDICIGYMYSQSCIF